MLVKKPLFCISKNIIGKKVKAPIIKDQNVSVKALYFGASLRKMVVWTTAPKTAPRISKFPIIDPLIPCSRRGLVITVTIPARLKIVPAITLVFGRSFKNKIEERMIKMGVEAPIMGTLILSVSSMARKKKEMLTVIPKKDKIKRLGKS